MRGSRSFCQGGPGQSDKKSSDNLTTFFFFFFFLFSPQLILPKSNGQFQRNLSFFKVPRGGPTFSRGGGVQLLIPYRNPYNLSFSRGVRTPCPPPPLDPHLDFCGLLITFANGSDPNQDRQNVGTDLDPTFCNADNVFILKKPADYNNYPVCKGLIFEHLTIDV